MYTIDFHRLWNDTDFRIDRHLRKEKEIKFFKFLSIWHTSTKNYTFFPNAGQLLSLRAVPGKICQEKI